MEKIERIYHRYENWECWKNGFFDNSAGEVKKKHVESVIKLFSSPVLTEKYMNLVIANWPYSCEHNLSNISLNRIAWLGQSACCIYNNVPASITMESWRLIDKKYRDKADEIAESIIDKYITDHNKRISQCLRFH